MNSKKWQTSLARKRLYGREEDEEDDGEARQGAGEFVLVSDLLLLTYPMSMPPARQSLAAARDQGDVSLRYRQPN